MLTVENEFRQPVSIDFAPAGSICKWCGKPAVHALTVVGGSEHNDSGYFCGSCSNEFIRAVACDLFRDVTAETSDSR
jgi:hypothetical protein